MRTENGDTEMLEFPVEETERVIEAMSKAEQTGDLEGLCWASRRLKWLYAQAETSTGSFGRQAVRWFNLAWDEQIKADPPPESIAAIINQKPEPAASAV